MLLDQSINLKLAERRIPGPNRSEGEKQEESLEEMPIREQTAHIEPCLCCLHWEHWL